MNPERPTPPRINVNPEHPHGSAWVHVKRWIEPEPEHRVLQELRSRPGRWAVLDEVYTDSEYSHVPSGEIGRIAQHHPRVETQVHTRPADRPVDGFVHELRARWLPEPEWKTVHAQVDRTRFMNDLSRLLREVLKP